MQFYDLLHRTGLIAAHRGNRVVAPENTLRAFEASLWVCDFIELDVQLSRDGRVVVMHDETPERTGGGVKDAVCSLASDALGKLDAGAWFYRDDPFGTVADGRALSPVPGVPDRIPTLDEVLEFAVGHGMPLNIEIKEMSGWHEAGRVIDAVLAAVEHRNALDLVLFSSFNHDYMARIKALLPDVAVSLLVEGTHPENLIEYILQHGAEGYHCDDAGVTEALVHRLREAGIFVGVYTVNDPERREVLFGWGVNAVFTDDPGGVCR